MSRIFRGSRFTLSGLANPNCARLVCQSVRSSQIKIVNTR
ncbi:Uncharacterized protein dnm_062980 [Desulfonema magnum]|uniref:Uncharacterized protein n=1 Tax=Desulfonema magnum TaxID=45655 RepID=A0A975GQN9_9BACT|nr:Uncharacterized protein dnm_062980 [Desulfonema magnum]